MSLSMRMPQQSHESLRDQEGVNLVSVSRMCEVISCPLSIMYAVRTRSLISLDWHQHPDTELTVHKHSANSTSTGKHGERRENANI